MLGFLDGECMESLELIFQEAFLLKGDDTIMSQGLHFTATQFCTS